VLQYPHYDDFIVEMQKRSYRTAVEQEREKSKISGKTYIRMARNIQTIFSDFQNG